MFIVSALRLSRSSKTSIDDIISSYLRQRELTHMKVMHSQGNDSEMSRVAACVHDKSTKQTNTEPSHATTSEEQPESGSGTTEQEHPSSSKEQIAYTSRTAPASERFYSRFLREVGNQTHKADKTPSFLKARETEQIKTKIDEQEMKHGKFVRPTAPFFGFTIFAWGLHGWTRSFQFKVWKSLSEKVRDPYRKQATEATKNLPYFSPTSIVKDVKYDPNNPSQNHDFYTFTRQNLFRAEQLVEQRDFSFGARRNDVLWQAIKIELANLYRERTEESSATENPATKKTPFDPALNLLREKYTSYQAPGFISDLKKFPPLKCPRPWRGFSFYKKNTNNNSTSVFHPVLVLWRKWLTLHAAEKEFYVSMALEKGPAFPFFYPCREVKRHEFVYHKDDSLQDHQFYKFCIKNYGHAERDEEEVMMKKKENNVKAFLLFEHREFWEGVKAHLIHRYQKFLQSNEGKDGSKNKTDS